ncbi:radical SAM protein, partial [Chloroflexota bacterium]
RGREKSLPADDIITEVRKRTADGYKEVVLTGTEIGSYSYDGIDLTGLLERILTETNITRLRLSSLQPPEISPELAGLWHDERLCPHFHLPLQNGSDSVLSRMKRHYSTGDYEAAVSLIRTLVPEAAITTDIIVGFPGETDEEFEENYNFCRKMGFARAHVFPYSRRPGTEAAGMSNQVPDSAKTQRNRNLQALASECISKYNQRFLGRSMPVLWEKLTGGFWTGHTANYIKVYARNSKDLTSQILPAKLVKIYKDGVWGETALFANKAS